MDSQSARQRFIGGLQAILAHVEPVWLQHPEFKKMVDGCTDAFADAECGGSGVECGGLYDKFTAIKHAACRATLRRECGLDGGAQP